MVPLPLRESDAARTRAYRPDYVGVRGTSTCRSTVTGQYAGSIEKPIHLAVRCIEHRIQMAEDLLAQGRLVAAHPADQGRHRARLGPRGVSHPGSCASLFTLQSWVDVGQHRLLVAERSRSSHPCTITSSSFTTFGGFWDLSEFVPLVRLEVSFQHSIFGSQPWTST